MFNVNYNPDILTCLANLSNDEVFTPPDVANKMLDLLPEEIWSDKTTTFLDPCTKSGIFLREITKRLLIGLENEIPNLQERIDHILTKQVFGIGITELTALLTRRSLYCSKNADQQFSITDAFKNDDGNILYKNIEHKWKNLKCEYCGVSKNLFNRQDFLEQHAYNFIHTENPKELFNMKFDVIIGNPPYQLNTGEIQKSFAISIYHKFIKNAIKLNPTYLSMIIPARWYSGGRGLDLFRNEMINDKRMKFLADFPNASVCFPGVQIKGGVCYFLWDKNYDDMCEVVNHDHKGNFISKQKRFLKEKNNDTFIRNNQAIKLYKSLNLKNFEKFSDLVSTQTPFGIISSFKDYKNEHFDNSVKFYSKTGKVGYITKDKIKKNDNLRLKYKILITKTYGAGEDYPHQILNKPFIVGPNSVCSQTYLAIGPFKNQKECENVISFIKTKFFRFLVYLKKNSQDNMRSVFSLVPILDFKVEWTDEKLHKHFNLNNQDIDLINSLIKEMELE